LASVPDMPSSGYELFFQIMPLRFYCLFALALVFMNAFTGRDFRAMRKAEARVRAGGPPSLARNASDGVKGLSKPGVRERARDALIPIGVVLVTILGWIIYAGSRGLPSFSPASLADWKAVFASEAVSDNSATILLGGSVAGAVVAFTMAVGGGALTVRETLGAFAGGLKTLFEAAGVLILAWAIKSVCDDLGTGLAMVALVDDALPPTLLPLAVFGLSGAVAFATGTSWGTMALVLPVAAPLSVALSGEPLIVLACLGAVLDGAIFGDHCSPISDTTVLSATATGCPLMDHVRTQMPYAIATMAVAGSVGYYGVVAGMPVWLCYVVGLAMLLMILWLFARPVPAPPSPSAASQRPS
jgi:Na+/H+ antiporter NhaC